LPVGRIDEVPADLGRRYAAQADWGSARVGRADAVHDAAAPAGPGLAGGDARRSVDCGN